LRLIQAGICRVLRLIAEFQLVASYFAICLICPILLDSRFPQIRNAHAKTAARSLAPPFSGDSTGQSVTS
jgi:hypothetical protein